MAKRLTIVDLREVVKEANKYLAFSGSNYLMVEGCRNGYQGVDIAHVNSDGIVRELRCLALGTAREVIGEVYSEYHKYLGEVFADKKLSRKMAKTIVSGFVDLSADYFTTSSEQKELLVKWAKLTKYRKPKNANGSLSRYFFEHLRNRVEV